MSEAAAAQHLALSSHQHHPIVSLHRSIHTGSITVTAHSSLEMLSLCPTTPRTVFGDMEAPSAIRPLDPRRAKEKE